jgi:hypothetical protein
VSHAIDIIRAV